MRYAVATQKRRPLASRKERPHRSSNGTPGAAAPAVIDRLRARVLHALEEIVRLPLARLEVEMADDAPPEVGQPAAERIGQALPVRLVTEDDRGRPDVEP